MKIQLKYFAKSVCRSMWLFSMFLIFNLSKGNAQGTCTLGVGGNANGINAPFDRCATTGMKFTSDAVIYRANTDFCYGTLTQIQYYIYGSFNAPNIPIQIYMKTIPVGTTSWAANTTYNSELSGATLVYSTTETFSTAPVGTWKTFVLSTPFTFTTGNLVVITESNYNATPGCGTAPVFGYATRSNAHQYWWNASSSGRGTMTGTRDQWYPSIRAGGTFLDVELIDFKGHLLDDGKVKLEWSTANEINNDYFIVQRSSDGYTYQDLTVVKGAGNSRSLLKYDVEDPNPFSGYSYYRLKQIDYDNTPKYSNPIYIELNDTKLIINNFHPNPTQNNINFDVYSPTSGPLQIQIMDYTGRIVATEDQKIEKGRTTVHTNMDGLAKGIYFIKTIFAETEFSSMNKIVKD